MQETAYKWAYDQPSLQSRDAVVVSLIHVSGLKLSRLSPLVPPIQSRFSQSPPNPLHNPSTIPNPYQWTANSQWLSVPVDGK